MDNFIKTGENKFINKNFIRWIKQVDDCYHICTKSNGCTGNGDTHTVCKKTFPTSFENIEKLIK